MNRSHLTAGSLLCVFAPFCLAPASAQEQEQPALPAARPALVRPVFAPVAGPVAGPVGVQPAKKGKQPNDGLTLQIEHFIDPADAPDVSRRHPCKIHTVKLDKESLYQIDLVGHGIDSYLRLLDDHGKQLAEDDDSGGNLNARIRYTTDKGGLFYIVATTFAGGEGAYTLSVRKEQPVPPRKVTQMKPVDAKKPSEVKDLLGANDALDKARGVPCHIHSIALKANKTYIIDLESTDFDAYLRLESPAGKLIQEDDDSGGNLNSRIEYAVPADGNYRLVAMPLHNAFNLNVNAGQNAGQYTLRVTEKE
jgi:hypothetical protein